MNKNVRTIKLLVEICASWAFRRYNSAFLHLVTALNKEGFEVNYQMKMSPNYGALEVYLEKLDQDRIKVFSKISSGEMINEENIPDIIENINNKL